MVRLLVDLGGTTVKRALSTNGDLVVAPEFAASGADVRDQVATAALSDLAGERPTAVALAAPGVVDAAGRRLLRAHDKYDDLLGVDLAGWAEDTFDAPAVVENDARAALLGEVSSGCADDARDAVVITLGTGIGTAAMIDGALVRGRHGHAGILGGHQTIDLTAARCPCGNVGCAESLASGWALASHGGLRQLITNADRDPGAAAVLERCVAVWGSTVVSLCHAYDPAVVVVTGGVMRAADRILGPLTDWVHRHLWSSAHRPDLRTPSHPDRSVLLGLEALAASREQAAEESS